MEGWHFLIFSITLNLGNAGAEPGNLQTLEQVHVIFRHGLRSPEKPYPGDPYSNASYWPQGWGALTTEGKRQQYELGKYLQDRYGPFVKEAYSTGGFYAVSSDSDRTIMSLLANLAGLFPVTEGDRWNPDLENWQPIPIRTIPRDLDTTIRGSAACPRYDILWKQLLEQPEFLERNEKFQSLYDRVGSHTGEKYKYPVDLTAFYEALMIEEAHNLTLPAWAKEIYDSAESKELLSFAFSLVVKTEEMKRLRGGPLLQEIVSNIDRIVAGDGKAQRFIMISGHDITLARIMDTINIFNPPHVPEFNAALIVELHRDPDAQKKFFLKVYYRNGNRSPAVELAMPQCGDPCWLLDFRRIFSSRIVSTDDWRKECNYSGSTVNSGIWFVTVAASLLALTKVINRA